MTKIAQTYIGNINDNADLAELIRIESYLEITLQQSDRQKGRIHAHTVDGVAVGIIKSRDRSLESGDLFKANSGQLVLIKLQEQELMVLDLSALESNTPENNICATKLVNLGHVLGNHHYPIMIQEQKVYIQLTTDKLILEKLIQDLKISSLQINYEKQSFNHKIVFSSHNNH